MRFDLQAHSTCSDGEFDPAEVVARAAAAGVELLALTDHDTVGGVAEALEAAREQGIGLVTAVEMSALDVSGADLHVLGYDVALDDERLLEVLERARDDRAERAERMAARLRELGFELDESSLQKRRAAGRAIGRPHLAAAVASHPANAERLREEGCAEDSAFLEAYLIPGRPAFSPRAAPTVVGAIELIHGAGGLAVWAHPFWDIDDPEQVRTMLGDYADAGLDGVEAFYVTHTREQTQLLHELAGELGLLTTGSSDFHGASHALLNRFLAYDLYGLEPDLGPIAERR